MNGRYRRSEVQAPGASPFELGDEEHLATRADRLEIGGLVERAVNGDGGLLLKVMAQAGEKLVHRLDDPAQILGLDLKFAYPAGVAAAEPGGEDNPRGHYLAFLRSAVIARSPQGDAAISTEPVYGRRDCFVALLLAMTKPSR